MTLKSKTGEEELCGRGDGDEQSVSGDDGSELIGDAVVVSTTLPLPLLRCNGICEVERGRRFSPEKFVENFRLRMRLWRLLQLASV